MELWDESKGYQWESFTSRLKTFDFHFYLPSSQFLESNQDDILAAYETSFWLELKHWFVACDKSRILCMIFTVPRFGPENIYWPLCDRIITSTSPYVNLYQSSHHLTWSLQLGLEDLILPNITSLELNGDGNFSTQSLLSSVDFSRQLPRLNSLVLAESLLMCFPRKMVLWQIRSLVINRALGNGNLDFSIDVNYLSNLFPRLVRLDIPVNSWHDLLHLVDTLKYLSCAVLRCRFDLSASFMISGRETLTRYWLICQSRRLSNNHLFTSRIDNYTIHMRVSSLVQI